MQSYVLMIEETAYSGVRRIAEKVAGDFEKVTGTRPAVCDKTERIWEAGGSSRKTVVILAATLGRSPLTKELIQTGRLSRKLPERIRGKRESYLRVFLPGCSAEGKLESDMDRALSNGSIGAAAFGKTAFADFASARVQKGAGTGQASCAAVGAAEFLTGQDVLLILGSDKRGTIYGLFSLSEAIGVTPLTFWGDAPAIRRKKLVLDRKLNFISKEPSVEYRGFFINDEWPAFGSWCTEHFGGFNASLYDCVFEFLLRMKGNYLWPAMWTSSFPLDGPGEADMELADEYGVIWSFSHHEPCLRASEEWDKVRGEDSVYGNAWDFCTNREGLLRYWGDALKSRGHYENMITIGMRGEHDSALLGENSPVKDNVSLLKEIISAQRCLIRNLEEQGQIRENAPQMLAVYKEVEEYYYGNEKIEGLYRWDGLNGVICMLSDDNFGHLRTLPTKKMREHEGGYGMYYHLDYHGGPVSYEWIDSTPLSQIREQMCEAWDYGVQRLWIVNVGDVKFHEVPLQYFMDLAYDFERWSREPSEGDDGYAGHLIRENFPKELPEMDRELQKKMEEVLTGYLHLAALRRPESLCAGVYHASHDGESDRMLAQADALEEKNQKILRELLEKGGEEKRAFAGYYSMIGWPAGALCNLVRLYLCEGKNHRYAGQGRPAAGLWAGEVRACLQKDKELSREWTEFLDGKWSGMEKPHHIGFTQWNDFGRHYPVTMELEPAEDPILCVSRADEDETAVRIYGAHESIQVDDFRYEGNREVLLEVSNNGTGVLSFAIRNLPEWLEADSRAGILQTAELVRVLLRVHRERIPDGTENSKEVSAVVEIAGSDETVVDVVVTARGQRTALPGQGRNGVIVLEAEDFQPVPGESLSGRSLRPAKECLAEGKRIQKTAALEIKCEKEGAFWEYLPSYGKYGSGWKVSPDTEKFAKGDPDAPAIACSFRVGEEGDYAAEVLAAPTNPLEFVKPLTLGIWARRENDEGKTCRGPGGLEAAGQESHRKKPRMQQEEITLVRAERTVGSPSNADWCRAVLDQERRAKALLHLERGEYTLMLLAREAGVIPERVYVYPAGKKLPESYLGPAKTPH